MYFDLKKVSALAKAHGGKMSADFFNLMRLKCADGFFTATVNALDWWATYRMATEGAPFDVAVNIGDVRKIKPRKSGLDEITADGEFVIINGARIKSYGTDVFPTTQNIGELDHVAFLPPDYIRIIKAALITTPKNDVRPVLNNILHRGSEVISTDAYRLFKAKLDGAAISEDILLKHESAKALVTLAAAAKGETFTMHYVEGGSAAGVVQYVSDSLIFVQPYGIDGKYPDINAVLKFDSRTEFDVDLREWEEVHRELIIGKQSIVMAEIKDENEPMHLLATEDNISMSRDYTTRIDGDNITIFYNPRFMTDAAKQLRMVGAESARMKLGGAGKPIILETGVATALVLPIRKNY